MNVEVSVHAEQPTVADLVESTPAKVRVGHEATYAGQFFQKADERSRVQLGDQRRRKWAHLARILG
jgi:hypothetical protein